MAHAGSCSDSTASASRTATKSSLTITAVLTTGWTKVCRFLFTHYRPDAMAIIDVRTYYAPTGTVVPGTGFRTVSPQEAVYHAIGLNGSYPAPRYVTGILFWG